MLCDVVTRLGSDVRAVRTMNGFCIRILSLGSSDLSRSRAAVIFACVRIFRVFGADRYVR
jgi:hypothetical protein